eukprot:gene5718-4080_t
MLLAAVSMLLPLCSPETFLTSSPFVFSLLFLLSLNRYLLSTLHYGECR